MINWIKSLFKKTPPDISEPVFSFVELVKNDPKRFRLNLDNEVNRRWLEENDTNTYDIYRLYDKKFRDYRVFGVLKLDYPCKPYIIGCKNISYLNPDELMYIYINLKPIFQARKDRLSIIGDQRKRERDIRKYCKEGV